MTELEKLKEQTSELRQQLKGLTFKVDCLLDRLKAEEKSGRKPEPKIEAGVLVKLKGSMCPTLGRVVLMHRGKVCRESLAHHHPIILGWGNVDEYELVTPAEVEVRDTVMTPDGVGLVLEPTCYRQGFYRVRIAEGEYEYAREHITILLKGPKAGKDC